MWLNMSTDQLLSALFEGITKNMMFVAGDAQVPNQYCVDFVTRHVRAQLQLVCRRSMEACKAETGKEVLTNLHLLRQFRSNPILLSRFLQFAKRTEEILRLSTKDASGDIEELSEMGDSDVESETASTSISTSSSSALGTDEGANSLLPVINDVIQVAKELGFGEDEIATMEDIGYAKRQQRMFERGRKMTPEEYDAFTNARKISFLPPPKRRNASHKKVYCTVPELLIFCGQKEISSGVRSDGIELILAFLAREVVFGLVEGAISMAEIANEPIDYNDVIPMIRYHLAVSLHKNYNKSGDLVLRPDS